MRVLVIGCGYVGLPLCLELVRQGHEVFGVRRTATADPELTRAGVILLQADITNSSGLAKLPSNCEWVVNCVASAGGGVEEYARLYREGTRNLIDWLTGAESAPHGPGTSLLKYVYTSSTGVYGQTDGAVVDEGSATEPAAETGRILLETEALLGDAFAARGFPAVILRLAGIYGPGRGYWLKQYLQGTAHLEGEGGRWLNMIHRDDVVGAVLAALQKGRAGEIYNLVDEEPVTQRALFEWLSGRLQRPLPESVPEGAPGARKRGPGSKRVSNRKLKIELGYHFKFPTFREGFARQLE